MLSMLLLLGGQLWLSYRDQVATAEIATYNLAAIFEARFEARLRQIDADLVALVREVPIAAMRNEVVGRYAQQVDAMLERRMLNREDMVGYRVLDAHGDLLYFSGKLNVRKMNVASIDKIDTR